MQAKQTQYVITAATSQEISRTLTLMFKLLSNADVIAAAAARPPGPPPAIATSTWAPRVIAVRAPGITPVLPAPQMVMSITLFISLADLRTTLKE